MSDEQTTEGTNEASKEIEGYEPPAPGGWEGYPLDELAIRDERRTAMDVVRRIENKRFILDPEFQRDFVWDKTKQSRLIESILLRIPLPVFYVAEDAEGRLIVVDGRQRLTTIQRFVSGALKLDLEDRKELNGKRFTDLEPRLHFYGDFSLLTESVLPSSPSFPSPLTPLLRYPFTLPTLNGYALPLESTETKSRRRSSFMAMKKACFFAQPNLVAVRSTIDTFDAGALKNEAAACCAISFGMDEGSRRVGFVG